MSNISMQKVDTSDIKRVIHLRVATKPGQYNLKALSAFLNQRVAELAKQEHVEKLSVYTIAERSNGLISQSTVHNILNLGVSVGGQRITTSVSPRTIQGFSVALKIPEQTLQDVMLGRYEPSGAAPPTRTVDLTVKLEDPLRELLEADAKRSLRTVEDQVNAIFKTYFKLQDVNITAISPADVPPQNAQIVGELDAAQVNKIIERKNKKSRRQSA
jgi:hypothetical protein